MKTLHKGIQRASQVVNTSSCQEGVNVLESMDAPPPSPHLHGPEPLFHLVVPESFPLS